MIINVLYFTLDAAGVFGREEVEGPCEEAL